MPYILGILGGAAIVGAAAAVIEGGAAIYKNYFGTPTSSWTAAGTISPPVGYISEGGQFIATGPSGQGAGAVQDVITASQVAAHQQLVGSMGNPSPSGDPTTDNSALWIVGIGVAAIILMNRK